MRNLFRSLAVVALAALSAPAQEPGRATVAPDPGGLRFWWEAEPAESPFRSGSWVSMTGVCANFAGDARIYGIFYGLGCYIEDNFAIHLTATGYYGDKLDTNIGRDEAPVYGAGLDAIHRCHVVHYDCWSLYVDGGVGLTETSKSVPTGGTNYNFSLQAGAGVTRQITDGTHFVTGVRWFHLSNGSFFTDRNPGYDSVRLHAGFLFSY
jgi:opacity protein-like surface antigen